jgi:23S rRNA (adenine2503-C2)-methyltransferase
MGCVFCATGQMGLVRDLTRGECVEQAVHLARRLKADEDRLSNVVFMGMGEPLANWPATWGTVKTLTDPRGFGMSPRRLTVSTVGLPDGIRRLARQALPVRLAVSLHAPDDELRSELVPVNATFPLAEVIAACAEYQKRSRRRLTIEYVLIDGVNDSVDQARRLVKRLERLRVLVNLIPLNPTDGSALGPSSREAALAFREVLDGAGVRCTLRARRGIDVQAGCGQLRSRVAKGRIGRTVVA